jgi:hypothetical protein
MLLAWLVTSVGAAGEEPQRSLLAMTREERAALAAKATRDELAAALKALTAEQLIEMGQKSVQQLGVYGVRLTKQERVKGELLEPQTIELQMRDQPMAARLQYVAGPAKGRRVLYNAEMRKNELRVREGGLLGLMALWVDLDSSLTRGDTNHRATDLGFGALLRLIAKDVENANAAGGYVRTDEGFDERGLYCMRFDAPKGAKGLYGDRTRLCLDPALGLPLRTEVSNGGQLTERYVFEDVRPQLRVAPDHFTPDAAGL